MRPRLHLITFAATLAACLLLQPQASARQALEASAPTLRRFPGVERKSLYIPMRDGVRLAATVYTPKGLAPGERTATVLQLTRYYRAISIKPIWRLFLGSKPAVITSKPMRERFVKAGYTWVDVDVRGTGASFGTWRAPFSPETVRDGSEVLDWIVGQPWSSGQVAAVGASYDAGLAIMQLSHEHPALKAVVSTFGIWNLADLKPGGLPNTEIVPPLSRTLDSLDQGRVGEMSTTARLFARDVEAVDRALLAGARRDHKGNARLDKLFQRFEFVDDPIYVDQDGRSIPLDALSPHAVVGRRSTVPVLTFSGWFDNAFSAGAIRQFAATRAPGSQLRIGPWVHGVGTKMRNVSPYAEDATRWAGHADEVMGFLDRHLRGVMTGTDPPAPVQYYVMGTERWQTARQWPPQGGRAQTYYFGPAATLSRDKPDIGHASDRYDEDFQTAGDGVRWGFSLLSKRVREFRDRRALSSKLLHYQTPPLEAATTIIGEPLVEISLETSTPDDGLFVYLEDVAPDGFVRYITEGQVRLAARGRAGAGDLFSLEPVRLLLRADARPMAAGAVESVVVRLLPTAFTVPAGHAIRLGFAGTDISSFQPMVARPSATYHVHRDAQHPSRLALPVYEDGGRHH